MIEIIKDIRECFGNFPSLSETKNFVVCRLPMDCFIEEWNEPLGSIEERFCSVYTKLTTGENVLRGYVHYKDYQLTYGNI